jgi:hypothetical protein
MKSDHNVKESAARRADAQSDAPIPDATGKVVQARKGRPASDTKGITLRVPKALLRRYTLAAADRTRELGRVVSAQEVMLERLDGGP